jgi:hypothetical protein
LTDIARGVFTTKGHGDDKNDTPTKRTTVLRSKGHFVNDEGESVGIDGDRVDDEEPYTTAMPTEEKPCQDRDGEVALMPGTGGPPEKLESWVIRRKRAELRTIRTAGITDNTVSR